MTEEKERYEVTPEEARQVLKAEEDRALLECRAEVERVLRRHGYELAGVPGFTADGRVTVAVQLRRVQP